MVGPLAASDPAAGEPPVRGGGGRRLRPPTSVRNSLGSPRPDGPRRSTSTAVPTNGESASSTRTYGTDGGAQRPKSACDRGPPGGREPADTASRAVSRASRTLRPVHRVSRSAGEGGGRSAGLRAPSGPDQSTLTPMPTTTATGGPGPRARQVPRPALRPPSIADQEVVGPFERGARAGHSAGLGGREGHPPPWTDGVGRREVRVGSRTDISRFAPGGASHRRPRRPRPAVWWSATRHHPAGGPGRASRRRGTGWWSPTVSNAPDVSESGPRHGTNHTGRDSVRTIGRPATVPLDSKGAAC